MVEKIERFPFVVPIKSSLRENREFKILWRFCKKTWWKPVTIDHFSIIIVLFRKKKYVEI